MFKQIITLCTLFLFLVAPAARASVLTLDNQELFGAPGNSVGWGFSIYNDSAFDLYVLRVYSDGTLFGTSGVSVLGAFRDDIAYETSNNGIIVASLATANGAFPVDGLASFVVNSGAPVGGSVNGKIYLDYELYDSNVDFQGAGKLTAQYSNQDALASITVTSSVVPEPSTYVLLCLSLGVVGYARKNVAKNRRD